MNKTEKEVEEKPRSDIKEVKEWLTILKITESKLHEDLGLDLGLPFRSMGNWKRGCG